VLISYSKRYLRRAKEKLLGIDTSSIAIRSVIVDKEVIDTIAKR